VSFVASNHKLLIFHNDAEGFAMLEDWIRKLIERRDGENL